MTRWLILAAAAALPLAAIPGFDLAATKNAAFLLLGALGVLALVRNPWVRGFAAWTLVAYLLAGAHGWALSAVLGVLAWAVLCDLARRLTEPAWRQVRLALVASVLFQVAWVGLQLAGRDPVFSPLPTQGGVQPAAVGPWGWFGNEMDLSLYLGVALPLLMAVRPVWVGLVGSALTAATILVILRTTVGAVAVGVTVLWLAWRWWPAWWSRGLSVGVVAGVGLGYLVLADPQGAGTRPLIWKQTAHLIGLRPFAGWGPNAVDRRVILLTPATQLRWNYVFNEWLQAWLEFGVLAPLLAAGYLVALGRRLRGRVVSAGALVPALAILLLASLFSIPLRIGPVALLAALVLGRLDALTMEAPA